MVLFKRSHIRLIKEGRKTQTRRNHRHEWKVGRIYLVKASWYGPIEGYIRITRKFRQKLGDISPEEIRKEGFQSLEEFRQVWEEINGGWNPEEVVTVYEFEEVKTLWNTQP